jgi:hypothetical protein
MRNHKVDFGSRFAIALRRTRRNLIHNFTTTLPLGTGFSPQDSEIIFPPTLFLLFEYEKFLH